MTADNANSGAARMDGQVALVTGAAGGIGRVVVRTLAEAGAKVIATDLGPADAFAGQANVLYETYDVTSDSQTQALVDRLIRDHGRIDALVLGAGIIANTTLADSTDEEWERVLDVNLMGVVIPSRRIFPRMCEQGGGKIVAMGSVAAQIGGVASGPAYVASKAAVHGLFRWMARAGAPHGVYANVISPGPVETPMWKRVTGGEPPKPTNVPLGRFGQPGDIAQAVPFLCSPASNWITGTTLDVNGGLYLN